MLRILAVALAMLALAGCTATATGHRPVHGVQSWHYHDHRAATWQPRPQWRAKPQVHHVRPQHGRSHHAARPHHSRPDQGRHHHAPRHRPPQRQGWWR